MTIANLKTLPAACFVDASGVSHSKVPSTIQNSAVPNPTPGGAPVGACNGGAPGVINVPSVIQQLADLYPQPNVAGYSSFNYSYQFLQPTSEDYGQLRIDHNFSSSDTAFLRWTQDDSTQRSTYNFEPYQIHLASWAQFGTVGENHIFTPTLLNTARLSFSRTDGQLLSYIDQNGPNAPGNLVLVPNQFMGDVGPGGGVTTIGSDTSNEDGLVQTIYTASDDIFWTKGKHAFKFGTLINYFYDNPEHVYSKIGGVSFTSLSNFFLGSYSSMNQFAPYGTGITTNFRYVTAGFYGQDDFRATNRLTLNLGLRYEFATVPVEPNQAIYLSFRNPLTDTVGTPGGWSKNSSLHNFSPRIGFAWDVFGNGKTSLRGGAGIYYDIGNYGGLMLNNGDGTPPASVTAIINNTSTVPAIPLTVPLPTNYLTSSSNLNSVRGVYYNLGQPTLLQRSLELDQQLPWNMGLSIGYVGSRGWHLVQEQEGNPPVPIGLDPNGLPIGGCFSAAGVVSPTGLTAQGACPTGYTSVGPRYNTKLGNAAMTNNAGNSYYNGLQVQLNKRVSQGLQFQFAYTYSRLIDTGQQENPTFNTENTQAFALYNERADRGPAVFDATQNLRFNTIYRAPTIGSNGIASKFANGWWFSAIVSAQTGYPFSPVTSLDRALEGLAGGFGNIERVNLDPSFNPHTDIIGSVNEWFDPSQFDLQPAGHYGNAGRDILRGPGYENVDFSAVKDTKVGFLGEAGSMEFRAEVFNLLNHANFANPNNTVYSGVGTATAATAPAGKIDSIPSLAHFASVGQITSTVSNSRQIQFAVKLIF